MNWIQLAGNATGMFSYAPASAHAVFDAANTTQNLAQSPQKIANYNELAEGSKIGMVVAD